MSQSRWKAQTKKTDESALHLAAAAGHTDTALALVTHKDAAVNVQDADDQEPVHHAVRKGDMKLFTALAERGATLKTTNSYGWKPVSTTTCSNVNVRYGLILHARYTSQPHMATGPY